MNTIDVNAYTRAWRSFAAILPVPRAVVVISAHWYVPGTRITAARNPVTVHDFNARFPRELFAFTYPARTDAALVERIAELLSAVPACADASTWGIDHGAYSVLAHLFPNANVPVVQIGIDRTKPPAFHYAMGQRLAPLRDEGVFVMASGNIVHNLELGDPRPDMPAYDWALRFDQAVHERIVAGDHESLVAYHTLGPDARLAVPTPEHYVPLLYTLGLRRTGERVSTIVDGIDFRSGGMRSLCFGLESGDR